MSVRFAIKPSEFAQVKDSFPSINGYQSVQVDRVDGLYLLNFDASKTDAKTVFEDLSDFSDNIKAIESDVYHAVVGVDGMSCKSCVGLIADALFDTKGVFSANVSLENNKADVWYDNKTVNSSQLQGIIEAAHVGKFKAAVKQEGKF